MKTTRNVQQYILENQIDLQKLEEATGVAESLLRKEGERPLNASEFLSICQYLGVKPEELSGV